jgi:hypothetical protein
MSNIKKTKTRYRFNFEIGYSVHTQIEDGNHHQQNRKHETKPSSRWKKNRSTFFSSSWAKDQKFKFFSKKPLCGFLPISIFCAQNFHLVPWIWNSFIRIISMLNVSSLWRYVSNYKLEYCRILHSSCFTFKYDIVFK